MGKGISGGVIIVYNYEDFPKPKKPGLPNTRYDLYRNGELHRWRWTDADGRPAWDRDFTHSGEDSHDFPHDHAWDDGHRIPDQLPPSDEWW